MIKKKAMSTYMVGIFIASPTTAHAKIKDIIAHLSDGEYEFLNLHHMGAFLLLNTDRSAKEIGSALSSAVAGDDRTFICEVGANWQALGLNKAAFWMQNHLIVKTGDAPARAGNPFGDPFADPD